MLNKVKKGQKIRYAFPRFPHSFWETILGSHEGDLYSVQEVLIIKPGPPGAYIVCTAL